MHQETDSEAELLGTSLASDMGGVLPKNSGLIYYSESPTLSIKKKNELIYVEWEGGMTKNET